MLTYRELSGSFREERNASHCQVLQWYLFSNLIFIIVLSILLVEDPSYLLTTGPCGRFRRAFATAAGFVASWSRPPSASGERSSSSSSESKSSERTSLEAIRIIGLDIAYWKGKSLCISVMHTGIQCASIMFYLTSISTLLHFVIMLQGQTKNDNSISRATRQYHNGSLWGD